MQICIPSILKSNSSGRSKNFLSIFNQKIQVLSQIWIQRTSLSIKIGIKQNYVFDSQRRNLKFDILLIIFSFLWFLYFGPFCLFFFGYFVSVGILCLQSGKLSFNSSRIRWSDFLNGIASLYSSAIDKSGSICLNRLEPRIL